MKINDTNTERTRQGKSVETFEVAIVGLGPVGDVAANLLGSMGFKVLAIDAAKEIWDKPRAIVMDHEVMRTLQQIGVTDMLAPYCEPYRSSEYHNASGAVLRRFDPAPAPHPLAWPPNITFVQPELERSLRTRLSFWPSLDVRIGHRLVGVEQTADECLLQIVNSEGEKYDVVVKYMLACDGASSLVRAILGLELEDLAFDEHWLVVDILLNPELAVDLPQLNIQFCDPARPATYVRGPGRLRRWEIMLVEGDDREKIVEDAAVWRLLSPWLQPTQATIWRSATYRFHALVAKKWRLGRVFLVGDAAHQSPPFLGQGMSQGIRDAANLCWKLAMVLHKSVPTSLLDTYEVERRPNVRSVIATTLQLGRIVCERDHTQAALRDKALLAEWPLEPVGRFVSRSCLLLPGGFSTPYRTEHSVLVPAGFVRNPGLLTTVA